MKILYRFKNSFSRKYFTIFGITMLGFLAGMPMKAQVNSIDATAAEMAVPLDFSTQRWSIVIHGGAGGPIKGTMTAEVEKEYLDKLIEALHLGSKILESGGSSLDAVETVVKFMEDCPLFNAGIGAVLNEYGKAELDAAIMDGFRFYE